MLDFLTVLSLAAAAATSFHIRLDFHGCLLPFGLFLNSRLSLTVVLLEPHEVVERSGLHVCLGFHGVLLSLSVSFGIFASDLVLTS